MIETKEVWVVQIPDTTERNKSSDEWTVHLSTTEVYDTFDSFITRVDELLKQGVKAHSRNIMVNTRYY